MKHVTASKTYRGVDVSGEGSVRDNLTAIGIPGIGHDHEPEGEDERLEGLHFSSVRTVV